MINRWPWSCISDRRYAYCNFFFLCIGSSFFYQTCHKIRPDLPQLAKIHVFSIHALSPYVVSTVWFTKRYMENSFQFYLLHFFLYLILTTKCFVLVFWPVTLKVHVYTGAVCVSSPFDLCCKCCHLSLNLTLTAINRLLFSLLAYCGCLDLH